ncbi:cytidine deaminase [Dictyoglomus thermophilum]|uniref:Cytidine deaminase n=2 Tax=Dictyoglomus thermophilum TaxID=14 RepID=B5YES9_DICT6|nr:cytidine deaminase [Dictyoglomus thermophilum]ACI19466.1 cytidine deaminase [Dictyoglomus thermophilum H-6-12]MCX7719706.1 cytidine deaminase [Dictyoglomus thermophilum]TYT21140.1 cytidine deaminase [Dictyoglomus thermophilum]
MDNKKLYELAMKALENSYSPYSNFPVGAALLTKDGNVYLGTNIENASYGLTICAERLAIFKAVSEGKREFSKIVIVGKDGNGVPPCGACRQVMFEFSPEMEILLYNKKEDTFLIYKVRDILPLGFNLEVDK